MLLRLTVYNHTHGMTRYNDYLFIIIHMLRHVIMIICSLSYTRYDMLSRLFVHNHTHGMTCYHAYLLIIIHMV
jgi:hypothetical protein